MNSNIVAYFVYLSATIFIIVRVGKMFHSNGRVFILSLYKGDAEPADNINNILLVAYYLFNIGYAFLKLKQWETIVSLQQLIASVAAHLGTLILILALTHYFNMLIIYFLSQKHNTFTHKI